MKQLMQLDVKIENLKKEVSRNQKLMLQRIKETIKTQEEIIMDMIKKFNEEFYQHKSNV
jgi:gas vesicle protein